MVIGAKGKVWGKNGKKNQYNQFQRFIVRASRKHIQKTRSPLITLDDYVNNFMENWQTMFNLLVLRLYETLADFIYEHKDKENAETEKGE